MILKIIGWTIGIILGIVLLLLLIVLLTPFRYKIYASDHEKQITADIRFHFWLRAVEAKVTFQDMHLLGKLRIFFIKKILVDQSFGKKEEDTELLNLTPASDKPEDTQEDDEKMTQPPDKAEQSIQETDVGISIQEAEDGQSIQETDVGQPMQEAAGENSIAQEEDEASAPEETVSYAEKDLEDKIDAILTQIEQKYQLTADKVEELRKKVDNFQALLTKESTLWSLKYLWKKLLRILKHIAPKKIKGELTLGLDNPATMGMICSYLAILYPFYQKNLHIMPVFDTDELLLEGEALIKGRILLMALVVYALPILFHKNIWRLLKDLKQLKAK